MVPAQSYKKGLRFLASLGLVSALTGLATASSARAADDSQIVVARDMDLNSLDPARAYCDTCQIYLSAVYDTLVTLGPDNKTLIPDLAEKWEVSPDVTTFTFHLNPAAKFSDGSPVTGDDVKWSLERLGNMKGGASYLMIGLKSIVVPDPHTVVITLAAPNSEFIALLSATYAGIINSKLASAHGANDNSDAATSDTADKWFSSHSAGSGAFTLESYRADDAVRLKRNDIYWGTKARVGGVILKQTANAVGQAQMLQSDTADIAMQIDPDTSNSIHDPKIVTKVVPSYDFVYVSLGPIAKGGQVLTSLKVRQALGLAIDYQGAIDFTVDGKGKLLAAPIPNGYPGSDGLPDPVTNVAKAKELLKEAGVPDGFSLNFEYPAMDVYGVDLTLLAQKLQQDLAKIKVRLDLKPETFNTWISDLANPSVPFSLGFWAPDYFGSAQYVNFFGLILGSSVGTQAGVGKIPEFDGKVESALLAKALAATPQQQDQAYHALALQMIADRIVFPILSPDLVLAYRSDISGVRYSACCNLPLAEIVKH